MSYMRYCHAIVLYVMTWVWTQRYLQCFINFPNSIKRNEVFGIGTSTIRTNTNRQEKSQQSAEQTDRKPRALC